MDSYGEDLAYIHDAGFGDLARAAAGYLLDVLRTAGMHQGRVVALGCGSGILAEQVCQAGFDVDGIDISPQMIALARQHAPRANLHVGSIYSAELPECMAVTAVGEVLNYRFDNRREDVATISDLFRRIHEALVPGGYFIFDVALPGRLGGVTSRQQFFDKGDWTVLVESRESAESGELTRRCITFRRFGELYRRSVETHVLHLPEPDFVCAQLQSAKFEFRESRQYGCYQLPAGLRVYTARKPA